MPFTDRSKAVLLLWIILCYLCLVFVMLSRLLIAALWSPAGKGLTKFGKNEFGLLNRPVTGTTLYFCT